VTPEHDPRYVSRRALLAVTGGAMAAGCLDGRSTPTGTAPATDEATGTPSASPSLSPDDRDVEPRPPGSRIPVSDFGADPDTGEDVTEAVLDAFAAANTEGATIVFEEGEYHLASPQDGWRSGLHYPLFELIGYEDLTIEGNGATWLRSNHSVTFEVVQSSGFEIKDLTVDWEPDLPMIEGHVHDETADYLDVQVRDNSPVRGDQPVTAFYFWNVEKNRLDYPWYGYPRETIYTEVVGDDVVRVPKVPEEGRIWGPGEDWEQFSVRGEPVQEGNPVILKHRNQGGIFLKAWESNDVVLRNLTLHSNPGMGVQTFHTKNFTAENVAFEPAHDHWIGHIADGYHLKSLGGDNTLRNIREVALGDDWLAVPVSRWEVERVDGSTLVASHGLLGIKSIKYHGFREGDEIAICVAPDPEPAMTATIERSDVAVDATESGLAATGELTLELDTEVPASVMDAPRTQIYNHDYVPDSLLVDNAEVSGVRPSSRLRSPNITIQNSTFENTAGTGIRFEHMARGVIPHNATVRNNTIRNLTYRWQAGGSSLNVLSSMPDNFRAPDGMIENVTIEDNTFEHERPETAAIGVSVAEDVTIDGNDFSGMPTGEPIRFGGGVLCETVTVDGQSGCHSP
jgi:hypothetical protein